MEKKTSVIFEAFRNNLDGMMYAKTSLGQVFLQQVLTDIINSGGEFHSLGMAERPVNDIKTLVCTIFAIIPNDSEAMAYIRGLQKEEVDDNE